MIIGYPTKKPLIPKITKPSSENDKILRKMLEDSLAAPEPIIEPERGKFPKPKQRNLREKLGTCFKNIDCQEEDVLLRNVTKRQCKKAGGKSWKGKNGCEQISD